nr:unnamed protein product [Spirometra erinaceieuropaei]
MMRHLHDGIVTLVTDNGAVSEAFAVTNGVTQGRVLAPTFFSLMSFVMLMDQVRRCTDTLKISLNRLQINPANREDLA